MNVHLTDAEWSVLRRIPESDLVDAASDLDMLAPEVIDHRSLIEQMLPAIVRRAQAEGLPFSKYDREDLEELDSEARGSIAKLQGLPTGASVDAMLKAGQKVYKTYLKARPNNPVALLLPTLLPVIARLAAQSD